MGNQGLRVLENITGKGGQGGQVGERQANETLRLDDSAEGFEGPQSRISNRESMG